jgi:hypothetical protein
MPCRSDPRDEADAGLVADAFNIPAIRIDLEPAYDALLTEARAALGALPSEMRPTLDEAGGRVALGNVRPRLRMTTLYFIANSLAYLVAGTGNRSELTVGYFTKHGDGGVDVLPIGHLLKSQVRRWRGIWRAADNRRQDTERGIVARPDRRGRDGLQLSGSRAVSDRRSRGGLTSAGTAARAPDPQDRAQTQSAPDARTVSGDTQG